MTIISGVGVSFNKNSFKAGKEATNEALSKLKEKKPNVLIVFASPKFNHQKLLDGITSITKDTPMIGGTTGGEISTEAISDDSIVIMAIHSNKIKFATALGKNISKNELNAGKQLATNLLNQIPKKLAKTLIMVPDGLAGNGTEIIKGAQSILGEYFEIVGGSLGDKSDFKKTYQYYNGKVYENSVPGLLLGGNIKTATGIRSGWESIGNKMKVTKSESNIVYELDNEPALDFYEKVLGPVRSKKLPGIALEYPFGMIDEKAMINGKEMYFQLRAPLSIDKNKKSITFAAAIPEGKYVTITTASRNSIIGGSASASKQAKETFKGKKIDLMLIFDCIGRKLVLGKRTQEEITAVQNTLGKNIPMIGFFTYGEIGPIDKRVKELQSTRYHNQTTIVFLMGEK
jgi:hypothetical protein